MGDVCYYGTYVFWCVDVCGFYSSCIFKYNFILCMVHSILSRVYVSIILYVKVCLRSLRYCVCIYIYIYTACPRRNVLDFGRMFLKLKYTDITKTPISELNGYGDNGERSLKV